eukprot:CAMPEP_0114978552 /NCGR_PEP_ID=MMETSP0216-20121206/3871_1 /TAXON_ID=223996 /ORGANISM="Protocruzia adherens, Strain Boccale" /LENGTH=172 /DNA_ID=CAMNT_0002339763 /DNA_START=638 /DNA_END=1156 /DNA_ORIENTATION=-
MQCRMRYNLDLEKLRSCSIENYREVLQEVESSYDRMNTNPNGVDDRQRMEEVRESAGRGDKYNQTTLSSSSSTVKPQHRSQYTKSLAEGTSTNPSCAVDEDEKQSHHPPGRSGKQKKNQSKGGCSAFWRKCFCQDVDDEDENDNTGPLLRGSGGGGTGGTGGSRHGSAHSTN